MFAPRMRWSIQEKDSERMIKMLHEERLVQGGLEVLVEHIGEERIRELFDLSRGKQSLFRKYCLRERHPDKVAASSRDADHTFDATKAAVELIIDTLGNDHWPNFLRYVDYHATWQERYKAWLEQRRQRREKGFLWYSRPAEENELVQTGGLQKDQEDDENTVASQPEMRPITRVRQQTARRTNDPLAAIDPKAEDLSNDDRPSLKRCSRRGPKRAFAGDLSQVQPRRQRQRTSAAASSRRGSNPPQKKASKKKKEPSEDPLEVARDIAQHEKMDHINLTVTFTSHNQKWVLQGDVRFASRPTTTTAEGLYKTHGPNIKFTRTFTSSKEPADLLRLIGKLGPKFKTKQKHLDRLEAALSKKSS